ncbi:MAG: hypothetical protein R3D63_16455 [Paracoccaceae bacterium]
MKAWLAPVLWLLPALPALAQTNLALGFYVDSTVGCANASNATLALLHRTGLNSARTDCTFTGFTAIGHNIYRYTETCTEIPTGTSYDSTGNIELLTAESFRIFAEDWETTMAYCPQSALPEPWRDNDLTDLLD